MVRKRLPPELVYEITRCVRAHDGWFGVYASTRMLQNFLSLRLEKWAEIGLINIFDILRAKEGAASQSGSVKLNKKEIRDVFKIEKDINELRPLFTLFKATTIPGNVMTKYVDLDPSVSLFYYSIQTFLQKYSTSRNDQCSAPPPLPATPVPLLPPLRLLAPAVPHRSFQTSAPPFTPATTTSMSRWLPATIQMYGEPDSIAPVPPERRPSHCGIGSPVPVPGSSHHPTSARIVHTRPMSTAKAGTSAANPSPHTSGSVVPHIRPQSTTKSSSKSGCPSKSTAQIHDDPCAGITLHTSTRDPHARPSAGARKRWQ